MGQSRPFHDRLAEWAKDVRAQAAKLPHGPERDALIRKARQAETATHLDEWASSQELQPPT